MKEYKTVLGFAFGVLAYPIAFWVPVLGPFLTGLAISQFLPSRFRMSAYVALASSITGTFALGYVLYSSFIGELLLNNFAFGFFVSWLFLLLSFISIGCCALGAAAGVAGNGARSYLTELFPDIFSREKGTRTYGICYDCGRGVPMSSYKDHVCKRDEIVEEA